MLEKCSSDKTNVCLPKLCICHINTSDIFYLGFCRCCICRWLLRFLSAFWFFKLRPLSLGLVKSHPCKMVILAPNTLWSTGHFPIDKSKKNSNNWSEWCRCISKCYLVFHFPCPTSKTNVFRILKFSFMLSHSLWYIWYIWFLHSGCPHPFQFYCYNASYCSAKKRSMFKNMYRNISKT